MTKVKFEVGKTYAAESSSTGTYVVVARTAKTVTLQEVKFQFRYGEYVRKDLDEVHRYKIREGWGICWKTEENRGWKQETVIVRHCAIRAFDDECALGEGYVNRQQIGEKDTSELDAEIDATVENLKEELEIAKTELAEVEADIEKGNDVEQNEALKKEYLDEIEDIKHNLEDWLGVGAGDDLEKAIELANCAEDYAVNVEAQEIAVNAEIDNANNAAEVEELDAKNSAVEVKKTRLDKNIELLKSFNKNIEHAIENDQKELADFDKFVEENGVAPEIASLHRKTIEARLSINIEKLTENEKELAELLKAAKVEEISPSIEKIFAAVTTEIKPHIKGKYFVQIDDNWREQNVRGIFATLEDAVKVARIMYNELRKVSRHIYATVEARTVDINKLWNRADDWTTFYEINSDGEKINRRETIAVIAKIDNRTVEEVRNDIGRCGDNYGFYKNSAPVEEVEAEKNPLKAKVAEILNRPRKSVIDWKAVYEDWAFVEIKRLQCEVIKFLKLSEIDLAENIFNNIKILCKNYREQFRT